MRQVFVDTSAWDALADSRDAHHELALLFRQEITGRAQLVCTNYVLDELYTLLLLNIGYQATVNFKHKLDILIQERVLSVVWVTEAIAQEAWQVFTQFDVLLPAGEANLQRTSKVLLGLTQPFLKTHLGQRLGSLSPARMREVDARLLRLFGLVQTRP